MPLTLLHLSDIHFHPPGHWDLDNDVHDQLIQDLRSTIEAPVDAVLLGGDIAYSGKADEFAKATDWIDRVLDACGGLDRSQVWTVPGNHDVDRTLARGVAERHFREAIDGATATQVNHVMHEWLSDDSAAEGQLKPLEAYNAFAANYICQTSAAKLAWEDQSLVLDGKSVRLTGINSVVNSGPTNDPAGSLAIGTIQCQFPTASGEIHVAMLHHPPAWIKDWTVVEPYMRRAHVVLFGHEHAAVAHQLEDGQVQLTAGAVAPERRIDGEEAPFLPTYGLIVLSIDGSEMMVEVLTRQWSLETARFEEATPRSQVFRMELGRRAGHVPEQPSSSGDASPLLEVDETVAQIDPEEQDRRRRLRAAGVKFMMLPPLRRISEARELGLWRDGDESVPPAQQAVAFMSRAREENLVDVLIERMGL